MSFFYLEIVHINEMSCNSFVDLDLKQKSFVEHEIALVEGSNL